ncbi:MAG: ATP-binding protein [Candidatus Cybelea sp.]
MYADFKPIVSKHYHAAYAGDIRNVAMARQGITAFARECGFSEEALSDIRLAAGEALNNAVEHGCGTPEPSISVECNFDGLQLTIMIEDGGRGFPEPSDRPNVEPNDRGRGFGIFLMRRLMDEVTFARNGSAVRLVRRHP